MADIFEIDFTGVESSNLIGEGTHSVRVSDAKFTKAQTGSDQLEVIFETASGATRKTWYNLLPQALWKLKSFLEVLGVPCAGKIKLSTRSLIGKTCEIVVEPDPNDSSRMVITKTNKIANAPIPEAVYSAPAQPVVSQPDPEPQAEQQQPNLPPWVRQTAPQTAQQSNLPPWMRQK